ncbi:MAG: DUF1667 domain-containing protein [Oscillospiraceae bacterium]|nr:DUF1667 domain-containing protein [Oscillospiraceae bacterium]
MREMTCLECPRGCQLSIDEESLEVTGNSCEKGEAFARAEITNPVRVLTTTAVIESGTDAMLPVRTQDPIPKSRMFEAMRFIKSLRVKAPVEVGDVLVRDLVGTGVALIATKSVKK